MATQMVLLSIWSSSIEMGGAPDSFCCDTSRRALAMGSVALDSRLEAKAPTAFKGLPAAEARKAEGTSMTLILMTNPLRCLDPLLFRQSDVTDGL